MTKKHNNPMAPYFVQMRELERRLIAGAMDAARQSLPVHTPFKEQFRLAAVLLGVEMPYLRVRARVIGGILENDPKHEPPVSATEAWARETHHARDARRARNKAKPSSSLKDEEAKPDA